MSKTLSMNATTGPTSGLGYKVFIKVGDPTWDSSLKQYKCKVSSWLARTDQVDVTITTQYTLTAKTTFSFGNNSAVCSKSFAGSDGLCSYNANSSNNVFYDEKYLKLGKNLPTGTLTATAQFTNGGSYSWVSVSPQTFTIKWSDVYTIPTITITYNVNGGANGPSSETRASNQSLPISSKIPTRELYKFLGWADNASATTANYQPGKNYSFTANKTLYAIWIYNMHGINYNANGGIGAPAPETRATNYWYNLSTTTPTRENYIFRGWADEARDEILDMGGLISYRPAQAIYMNRDYFLYAVWQKLDDNQIRFGYDNNIECKSIKEGVTKKTIEVGNIVETTKNSGIIESKDIDVLEITSDYTIKANTIYEKH